MIKKYIKKPIPIEAILLTNENIEFVIEWIRNSNGECFYDERLNRLYLRTLEGYIFAIPNHFYIVKGVKGEFYPVERTVFEESYEEVK